MAAKRRRGPGRPKKGRRPARGGPRPPPLPGQPIPQVRRKRKRRIKLSLRSHSITGDSGDYKDLVGWTSGDGPQKKSATVEDVEPIESEFIKHQCSLCGAVMQISKPKRVRYTIICPHCEHQEKYE